MKKESRRITEKKFIEIMKNIQEAMSTNREISNTLADWSQCYFLLPMPLLDDYIALLQFCMDDGCGFIEDFIYENNFGKKPLNVENEDGTSVQIKTVKQLYKFLTE